ncbi:hypothetical protein [Demequina activiva]|uniref:Uncharacterized protein n=1 Tax=Demequina activiva TaxID=1582364 RepID=A0A919UGD9_9MICO|nr:hypothetical protein [Demequina activiva]GIG54354.1 hypothetical protein Dac01nite_11060 [Demequina activiva]
MDDIDAALRALLTSAAGSPTVAGREELLASLTARIDSGGADVALAPASPTFLDAVDPAGVGAPSPARRTARAAGIGVGGWLALAAGAAAAAAASAWFVDRAPFDAEPVPGVSAPPSIVDVRVEPAPTIEAVIPGITAPEAARGEAAAATSGPRDGAGSTGPGAGPVPAPGVEPGDARQDSPGGGSGQGGRGSDGGGSTSAADGLLDVQLDVDVSLGDVEDAVKDTVEGVLPEGPLQDTVAPVIHAVNVSGLASWAVDSLVCGEPAPVSVQASDNRAVTAASLRVTTATGHSQLIPLSGAGGTWSGVLAPITALDLGLLSSLVVVDIEVRDAAGNVTMAQREVAVGVASCLLG